MAQIGWKINLDRCIGCTACMVACKAENNTYPTTSPLELDRAGRAKHVSYRWVVEQESGEYPSPKRLFVTVACNHCIEPACIAACPLSDDDDPGNPANVIVKRASDGIVLLDVDSCIGCRYCEAACPYGAPQFNPVTKKVEKCTACVHRLGQGFQPACVSTCVGGALELVADFSGVPGNKAPPGFAPASLTKPAVEFVP
jgi:Fe-S-cluster-containing dehydrogenase component